MMSSNPINISLENDHPVYSFLANIRLQEFIERSMRYVFDHPADSYKSLLDVQVCIIIPDSLPKVQMPEIYSEYFMS